MATPQPSSLPLDRSLFHPGDRVCVAISGGADSVALLLGLLAANATPRHPLGIGISALHLHHGLRGEEADGDQAFVEALCARIEVPLQVHHVDVRGRVTATGESIEEAARHLRYQAFSSFLARGDAQSVLTAHTIEDQAETVLLKLIRGAWTAGLGGIHPVVELRFPDGTKAGRVLRPLLNTHRAQVEAFLRDRNQTWREDSSNLNPAYTRNRVRHEVLPLLRSFNPSVDETLAQTAEIARDEEVRWQEEVSRLLPQVILPGRATRGGGRSVGTQPQIKSVAFDIERLRAFDLALRRRLLRAAARQLGCSLDADQTRRTMAICGFGEHPNVSSRPGATLELAQGLRASRSVRELCLTLPQTDERSKLRL